MHDTVLAVNSDEVLCAVVGMYSDVVSGILNQVEEINFHVLSNGQLKYSDYIEKCISGWQRNILFPYKRGGGERERGGEV